MVTSFRSKWAAGKARGGRIRHQFYSSADLAGPGDRWVRASATAEDESRAKNCSPTVLTGAQWRMFCPCYRTTTLLIVVNEDNTVEVTHEALIHSWGTQPYASGSIRSASSYASSAV
jgi:hypothetical protein